MYTSARCSSLETAGWFTCNISARSRCVSARARLARIHVHYEDQPQFPLAQLETPGAPLDWRVEKMRLSKDRTQLTYNRFLTLDGIPPAAFSYRLGNRSAFDWVIDQYRVKTDKRSGITNDPSRPDDPQYILRLLAKVISVSLETVDIVEGLPELGIAEYVAETPSVPWRIPAAEGNEPATNTRNIEEER